MLRLDLGATLLPVSSHTCTAVLVCTAILQGVVPLTVLSSVDSGVLVLIQRAVQPNCPLTGGACAIEHIHSPCRFRFGVDLVFSGHVHAFERSHPVYRQVWMTAPTLFVTSTGRQLEAYEDV